MQKSELNSLQDESRPVCSRCQRCGLECEGPKDITFVEGKIVKSRRTEKPATFSTRGDCEDTDYVDHQIPLSASLRGNEFEMYICYSRKHLHRGGAIDLVLQKTQLSEIIPAGTPTANGQIFHQAILSFSIILFGAQHGQANITARGYAMHGVALKLLNQVLSDLKCYTRDDVILSVATLAILECLVPTGPKSYLKHMVGLERLLELRDPNSYCSPISSALYKSVRHMLIFASLRMGKPSILAREEWKKVLRANCSDEEMQEQDLFDVLADCTVLISERDNVLANSELDLMQVVHRRDKIKQRALTLLTHLRACRKRWDSDGKNSYVEISADFARLETTHELRGADSPPFLTFFEFSNESAAILLMFYNTALIYVLRILASLSLENLSIDSDQSFSQITLLESTKDEYVAAERLAAFEVCRCIPYYLAPKSRLDSDSPVVHWAVTTAWMTLCGNDSSEGKWMMDLLKATSLETVAKGLWAS
jgi:Fungal specific transcription factor domain